MKLLTGYGKIKNGFGGNEKKFNGTADKKNYKTNGEKTNGGHRFGIMGSFFEHWMSSGDRVKNGQHFF